VSVTSIDDPRSERHSQSRRLIRLRELLFPNSAGITFVWIPFLTVFVSSSGVKPCPASFGRVPTVPFGTMTIGHSGNLSENTYVSHLVRLARVLREGWITSNTIHPRASLRTFPAAIRTDDDPPRGGANRKIPMRATLLRPQPYGSRTLRRRSNN